MFPAPLQDASQPTEEGSDDKTDFEALVDTAFRIHFMSQEEKIAEQLRICRRLLERDGARDDLRDVA